MHSFSALSLPCFAAVSLEMLRVSLVPSLQALNVSKQLPLTAALVDGLELGPLLAKGSFGSVFRGRFKGKKVAVKVREDQSSLRCVAGVSRAVS